MAFFDELGKALSGKGKEAATKVRDLTEILQLKNKLSSEKEKVNKAYINLGMAYYDKMCIRDRRLNPSSISQALRQ